MFRLPESQGLYLEAEKAMAPHSSTLAQKIPWTKEPGGLQSMGSWSIGYNFTFTFHFHALEKEMATHSSVPAWRIPGTAEPGGLPSMGLHRVGHNLAAAASRSWRPLCVKKGSWSLSLQNEQLAAAFAQGRDKMGYVLCIDLSLKLFDQGDGGWMELEGRRYQVREGLWFYLVGWDWSMCIGTENKEKNRDRDKDRDRHRCMRAKLLQSCLTLCDPMDRSLPGSSVHGILQERILEWTATPFPEGIFPTQGSNPSILWLLHCTQILYPLSHLGSPERQRMTNPRGHGTELVLIRKGDQSSKTGGSSR